MIEPREHRLLRKGAEYLKKDPKKAAAAFEKVRGHKDYEEIAMAGKAEALRRQAERLLERVKTNEAERLLHSAIELNDKNPEAHALLGSLYLGSMRLQNGFSHYKKAIRLYEERGEPDALAEVLLQRGGGLLAFGGNKGAYKKALRDFERAAEVAGPGMARPALAATATAQSELDMHEEAARTLRKLIRTGGDPAEDSVVHTHLGETFIALGQRDKAIGEFKEAVRLDTTNTDALVNLAEMFAEYGKSEGGEAGAWLHEFGRDYAKAAMDVSPKDPDRRALARYVSSSLALRKGLPEVEETLKRVSSGKSSSPHLYRALVADAQGRHRDAVLHAVRYMFRDAKFGVGEYKGSLNGLNIMQTAFEKGGFRGDAAGMHRDVVERINEGWGLGEILNRVKKRHMANSRLGHP